MSPSTPNPERVLERLEWTVIRRLDGLFQGDYRTLFRGFGLDLAELREYQPGDDVRSIDWNVTARMNEPYVRQYYEDREISAWFLLDLSPSMDFGSTTVRKRSTLIDLVGVLGRLLTRHGNRIGAIIDTGARQTVIPAHGGRRHLLALLHTLMELGELDRSPPTSLTDLLATALRFIRRRSFVLLVSDFVSLPGWERPLAAAAARHETIAVRVVDPFERELPDLGIIPLRDAESSERLVVDTHDRAFRRRFAAAARHREETIAGALCSAHVDLLELSTASGLVEELVRFAELRRERAASGNARHSAPRPGRRS